MTIFDMGKNTTFPNYTDKPAFAYMDVGKLLRLMRKCTIQTAKYILAFNRTAANSPCPICQRVMYQPHLGEIHVCEHVYEALKANSIPSPEAPTTARASGTLDGLRIYVHEEQR